MIDSLRSAMARRSLAGALVIGTALSACAAQAAAITMYRDPNCGCCLAWADHMEQGDKHEVTSVDHPDMGAVKAESGVPNDLRSCHTAIVEGYVIEGHVPAEQIEKLLEEKPEGVIGLAVPGMPIGSPGMEVGNRKQPYQVIAFRKDGSRFVFATYG